MSIITATAQLTEKNTRTVNTKNGETLTISVPMFEKEKGSQVKVPYATAFLPSFVKIGDIVTVSGRVQAKESGEYVNYNFVFPTVEKVFMADGAAPSQAAPADFGRTEELDIADDDLPF